MALVSIQDLSIGFRGPSLLDGVNCQIESGDRIGLLGRNGAGKSTFMKLLCAELEPDHGSITLQANARVARLQQDVPQAEQGAVAQFVASGFQFHGTTAELDESELAAREWERDHAVEKVLTKMKLDGEASFATLSSGLKRRVLLAQALVSEPELLLLDEPTNHLDVASIEWLEDFLLGWKGTLLFVTHDRMFLRKLATRILEIDRGQLFDWSCDYDTFLRRKEAAVEAQLKHDALFDKKLAEEEVWIRQGIKARRTRNEGRVKALEAMRNERSQRRSEVGKVKLQIQESERSGNLVAHVEKATFAYSADRTIFEDVSISVMRGDKIGVVGPNGVGKTTLLRVILGSLTPTTGEVRLGTNLQIAYFDQLRESLDETKTVVDNVGDGYDTVNVGGQSRHVIGYLQDFLFTPERARTEVRFLSGGERNRILLAKLFAKPANVIVLDEPTNDLDAETLELLEERLIDFKGTVLMVSHDRAFLNNVVTSTLVFEEGTFHEYVGGYDDWLRQRRRRDKLADEAKPTQGAQTASKSSSAPVEPLESNKKRKLSYKEQQEYSKLPDRIESLEESIAKVHATMSDPDFYQKDKETIAKEATRLKELEQDLEQAYLRWESLEEITNQSSGG